MEPIDLAALGTPCDAWEIEMLAVARRELEKAAKYEQQAQALASVGGYTAAIAMADNAIGYAEALLYAVRRRREVFNYPERTQG